MTTTSPPPCRLATARTAGLLYLAVAVTGGLGFLLLRPTFVTDDPADMLGQLVDHEGAVRLVIGLELALVLSQALVALWLFRLFRAVGAFAAGAVAVFGLMNAVAILGSAASLTAALETALDPVRDGSANVALLVRLSEGFWAVGGLFFGAWLAPMGWLALRAGLPRALGWLLMVGAVGYVIGAFLAVLLPGSEAVATVLALPATAGELWMVGYLLHGGVFRDRSKPTASTAPTVLTTQAQP